MLILNKLIFTFTLQIRIKSVSGLPPCLSNFVFCQYSVWAHNDAIVVPPSDTCTAVMGSLGAGDLKRKPQSQHAEDVPIKFEHCKVSSIIVALLSPNENCRLFYRSFVLISVNILETYLR